MYRAHRRRPYVRQESNRRARCVGRVDCAKLERLRQFLGTDNAAVDDLAKRPRTIPDDSAGPTMSSGIFSPSIDLTGYRKSAATVPTCRKPIVKTPKAIFSEMIDVAPISGKRLSSRNFHFDFPNTRHVTSAEPSVKSRPGWVTRRQGIIHPGVTSRVYLSTPAAYRRAHASLM